MFQVEDIDSFKCPITIATCENQVTITRILGVSFLAVTISLFILYVTINGFILCYYRYKHNFYNLIKKMCHIYIHNHDYESDGDASNLLIVYSEKDENFVITEMVPNLKCHKHLKVYTKPVNKITSTISIDCYVPNFLLVILTANYLRDVQNEFDVNNIYDCCVDKKDIIFVIVSDFGCDVALNPFLKEHVINMKQCVTWREPNFWKELLSLTRDKSDFATAPVEGADHHASGSILYDIYSTT